MRPKHSLFTLLWLALLSVLFLSLLPQTGQGQKRLTVIKRELKLNEKINSPIKEGEVHRYPIELKKGQALRANIKEKGIDVSGAILHHNPANLDEYHRDGYESDWGRGFERETLIFVADRDGQYSVNVRGDTLSSKVGSYEIEIFLDSESIEKSWDRMKAVEQFNFGAGAIQTNSQAAIISLKVSLGLWEQLGEKYWIGKTNYALGLLYYRLGKPTEAAQFCKTSLEFFGEEDRYEKAVSKMMLGDISIAFLLDIASARKGYEEAIKLIETLEGNAIEVHARSFLSSLNQEGFDYNKFLAVVRAKGDKELEALAIAQIITSIYYSPDFVNSEERVKAIKAYSEQALTLSKENMNIEAKATMMFASCFAYSALVEGRDFEPFCYDSLMLNHSENKFREVVTLAMIFHSWAFEKNNADIFYGKQAVKGIQEFRTGIKKLDKELQQNYLKKIRGLYRELVDSLIAKGRYNEAHQIINLSRDEEFFDFNLKPTTINAAGISSKVDLTEREKANELLLQSSLSKVSQAYKDLDRIKGFIGNNQPRPEDAKQLESLQATYKQAYDEYLANFKRIEADFSQPVSSKDKIGKIDDTEEMQKTLRTLENQTGQKNAVIYTIEAEDNYRVLLITPDKVTAVSYPIESYELQKKNIKFLEHLSAFDRRTQKPEFSEAQVQKTARELHDILFAPINAKFKELNFNPDVLMWSLDGTLRYIPVNALYDGKQYLAERYRNVVFTRANSKRMLAPVSEIWRGSGFYNSQEYSATVRNSEDNTQKLVGFKALKFAKQEVETIFGTAQKPGIIGGKFQFNKQFTKKSFSDVLKLQLPLIHIASHFRFEAGDSASSFLVLGDSSKLTLEDIKNEPDDFFKGVELLTLSACETAVQKERESDGREIDGFAELAQRKGANAILASLWKVDDESTSQLMTQFYRLRQPDKTRSIQRTKVEALQEAQLSLIKNKNYSHPHYWAPFILIGNWK